ncbi:protein vav isoform X2 [Chironomus tepperi]|uniref:protein vav isoform X2 n=1 Tax=Chironomus tepperi TaxID=113505 RepID=UPI00391FBBA8
MALSDDLWRECAAWLTRCKIIPGDHKANWPSSEIKILALTLRDGVLLCNLIHYLDPTMESIEFNRRPRDAQFLCLQNIRIFLECCKNNFQLKENELFECSMLYDLTNFHRVLITLSKLSLCRRVQINHPNLPGFSVQSSVSTERSISEEDIYKELQTTATATQSDNAAFDCNDEENTKEEEVYQDLCAIQNNIARNQRASATTSLGQRDYVIRELVETESNYLIVLNDLKYKFMQPMEKMLKDEIKIIFPRIKELVDIHIKFLDKLREATEQNPKCKLSSVFLDFREQFLIYGDYCANMTDATETLRDVCKRSSAIEQLVAQCQKDHSGGRVQLRDILSVPMQRILKYHLLLDKLVHDTSSSHDDYKGLQRAKEAMVDVAQYINEVKRDCEQINVIKKVRESIIDLNLPNGNDLSQYGRLLLDGDLNIKAHEDQKHKHRYAFIFEKIMILVKNSNTRIGEGQYTFREAYNLGDYRIEMGHSRKTLGRDARFKYQLLLARKSNETAFTLYMKTEGEREKWMKALNEAMEMIEPFGCKNTDHKFQLNSFEKPTICRHCSRFLKGLIHQGYKCKVCEICVHKGCISSSGRCKQPPLVCDRYLSEFNWFVGTMDRENATSKLENRRIGTYLLRCRPQGASNSTETLYALSLKTDNRVVKHMKIYQKVEDCQPHYFLSTRRYFRTIVELVSFYERNDLGENFAGLNQVLQWPFYERTATAIYDFTPKEPNQLPLKKGCQIYIISKEGDSRGWLKGRSMDRIGFFPKGYVQENCPNEDL